MGISPWHVPCADVLATGTRVEPREEETDHENIPSRPRGHDLPLGFDPRGATVVVRGAAGDVLVGAVADPVPSDDGDVVCCIPDDSGPECEDRSSSQCLAAGGVVVSATSCATDPCAATPSPTGDVICCLPDRGGDGANEREDLSPEACTTAGGTASSATSCTPDPCNTGVAARHGRGADDPAGDDRRLRRGRRGAGRGGHDDGPNHR